MPFASINGQEIFYSDVGTGPVVVLAHGFLMDSTMFQPQVNALTPEFRVITWDERGFGQTKTDGKPFTYWDSASDCIGLLDHLKLDSAIIGGHSQGGFLTLRAALLAPTRVRAVILIDTEAVAEDPIMAPGHQKLMDGWVAGGPSLEVSPAMTIAQIMADIILADPALKEIWMAKWFARPKESIREAGQCLLQRDCILSRLGEITCPAFIVHGATDAAISLDHMRQMHAGLVGAREPVIIQGAGHACNLTHPELVNAPLLAFLREVTATA